MLQFVQTINQKWIYFNLQRTKTVFLMISNAINGRMSVYSHQFKVSYKLTNGYGSDECVGTRVSLLLPITTSFVHINDNRKIGVIVFLYKKAL